MAVDQPVVQRRVQLLQPQHVDGVEQRRYSEGVLLGDDRVGGCGAGWQQAGRQVRRRRSAGQGGFVSPLLR